MSDASTAPTEHTLPALQTKGPPDDLDRLEPVLEDDPGNFDLLAAPPEEATGVYPLEKRSEQLMSKEHLRLIFQDPKLLLQFTGFLNSHRPRSVRTLVYYLDSLKALRAIDYANAISEALEPLRDLDFTNAPPSQTMNKSLHDRADQAFDVLVRDDLPAFIAYSWIQIVSESIQRRITGTLAPHLREASEGLAEVFCLSDPSRKDNPIVFASEEFQRTTQYGMGYSVGRNCRFLQGPGTNPHSVRRLAEACKAGKEHSEVFLNYRRDGSPFMNLLMIAPLSDSKGVIRYFIGAQVDVSGLVKDCTGLEAYQRLLERAQDPELAQEEDRENQKDEFQSLSEMFNTKELEAVRRHGGRMHRDQIDDEDDRASVTSHRPRLLIQDPTSEALESRTKLLSPEQALSTKEDIRMNGRLQGVYQHVSCASPILPYILLTSPVSLDSPSSIAPDSLLITIAARTWYPAVSVPVSHRRIASHSERARASIRRRTRCHRQDPLADTAQRGRRRRWSKQVDPLHTTSRPHRCRRGVDGGLGRRRDPTRRRQKEVQASASGCSSYHEHADGRGTPEARRI